MFNISTATEKDIPIIARLAEETWWPTYRDVLTPAQIRYMLDALYSADSLHVTLSAGTQIFVVLRDDQEPKGFASYGKRPDESAAGKLHRIYVLPQAQKTGYGRALIQEVKNRMAAEGIHILDLNVNRYNTARFFYEKMGFKIIREEDVPIGPYWMNDYVMRLEW